MTCHCFPAVAEQHNKLKQHTAELESSLAQKESSLIHMNAANMATSRKCDQTEEEQRLKVRQLEEDLCSQNELAESLQNQVSARGGTPTVI